MEERYDSYTAEENLHLEPEGTGHSLLHGIKAGTFIALGYMPIAITFGLLAKSYDVPLYVGTLMSFMVFAGASQFIAIELIHSGSTSWEIILTTFILNFRHFLMSSSLSQKIAKGVPKKLLFLLTFGITDETFAVASLREEKELSPVFMIGLNTISFLSWNVGTWIGSFAANILPESLRTSMGIALYAMFIALLVPSLKKSKPVFVVSMLSISLHSVMRILPIIGDLSKGWTIIFSTVISSLIGAVLFPSEVN